jgi:hypothetical protein
VVPEFWPPQNFPASILHFFLILTTLWTTFDGFKLKIFTLSRVGILIFLRCRSNGIIASLSNISDLIDARTKTIPVPPGPPASHQHDRAGPPHATLTTSASCNNWNQDVSSLFLLSEDLLEVQNRKDFASIFANASVCRGKWQYEATIVTHGIMQIGWMNPTISFEKHDGVGDEFGSFAFDGGRRKKWGEGLSTSPYGLFWTSGDVVGCLIDLDNKTVSFTLNGIKMGEAWNEIPTGSFYAPAVRYLWCLPCLFTIWLTLLLFRSLWQTANSFGSTLARRPCAILSLAILF